MLCLSSYLDDGDRGERWDHQGPEYVVRGCVWVCVWGVHVYTQLKGEREVHRDRVSWVCRGVEERRGRSESSIHVHTTTLTSAQPKNLHILAHIQIHA